MGGTTAQQLIEHTNRRQKGVTAVLGHDGEYQEPKTTTAKVYHLIWFFGPILITRTKLSASDLQKYLREAVGLSTDIKLIQRVHTALKIASRFKQLPEAT